MKQEIKKYKAKEDFAPLYWRGDLFVIVERSKDEGVIPLKAMRLRDKGVYYFDEDELEVCK